MSQVYKKILCPVDGSPTSNRGLAEAIRLAKDQGATLYFLHVIEAYFSLLDSYGTIDFMYLKDMFRKNANQIISVAEDEAKKTGVVFESQIIEAYDTRTAETIMNEANRLSVDLIVMGTHGLRGFSRLVLGSDAEHVLRTTNTPVLIVKVKR